jgi:hypothetical protein
MIEIGKLIHYDFSDHIPELRRTYVSNEESSSLNEPSWKDKYIALLEEHQRLLARLLALQEEK